MPTTSTHSQREYGSFFQHRRSTELRCFSKASFTFWTIMISGSNLLKLQCISLISLARLYIVLRFCLWVFNVLFKDCNVSSVSTPAITSMKMSQVWKDIKKNYLFTSIQPTKMRPHSIDTYGNSSCLVNYIVFKRFLVEILDPKYIGCMTPSKFETWL